MSEKIRVAIVQKPPVVLDRDATVERTIEYLDEVADEGAQLAVFPETYVPGYPFWAWYVHPLEDIHARGEIYGRLLENSVDLEAGDLEPLQARSAAHGMVVVIGVNERSSYSRTSLYNTLVTIGSDGSIRNVHRKLVPTYVERNVWAPGDGAGLRVVETELGRIGGLICWENLMPLARYSLYAQGVDIYVVSTYDAGDASVATMRHIAREARSWVVCSGVALHRDDIPADFPARDKILAQLEAEWQSAGDSVVVSPGGHIVAGPLRNEYGILYADIDPAKSRQQGWYMDTAGHYNRPDVFTLTVDRTRRTPVTFVDTEEAEAEGSEGE